MGNIMKKDKLAGLTALWTHQQYVCFVLVASILDKFGTKHTVLQDVLFNGLWTGSTSFDVLCFCMFFLSKIPCCRTCEPGTCTWMDHHPYIIRIDETNPVCVKVPGVLGDLEKWLNVSLIPLQTLNFHTFLQDLSIFPVIFQIPQHGNPTFLP